MSLIGRRRPSREGRQRPARYLETARRPGRSLQAGEFAGTGSVITRELCDAVEFVN